MSVAAISHRFPANGCFGDSGNPLTCRLPNSNECRLVGLFSYMINPKGTSFRIPMPSTARLCIQARSGPSQTSRFCYSSLTWAMATRQTRHEGWGICLHVSNNHSHLCSVLLQFTKLIVKFFPKIPAFVWILLVM